MIPHADDAARENRCARIVDAARTQAAEGGYAGITMRTVAVSAGASTATIYRYFPSKPHLVMAIFSRWLEEFERDLDLDACQVEDPRERLGSMVVRLHAALYHRPRFANAVAQAYVLADCTAAFAVEGVRSHMSELFAEALGGRDVTSGDAAVGALVADVWVANMVAVAQGRITPAGFQLRLAAAVRLLTSSPTAAMTSARGGGPMR